MYVGIDVGGTNLKAGLTDESGKILAVRRIPLGEFRGSEAFVETLAELTKAVARDGGIESENLEYVGMGFPGAVAEETVLYTCNIPLENVPVGELFRRYLPVPVILGNDADCAAVGEYFCGAGRGTKNFCVVTLGTGVGGGMILNGKLYSGMGAAGEVGHMVIRSDGVLCSCGRKGCWETYASATGLIRMSFSFNTKNELCRLPVQKLCCARAEAYGILLYCNTFNSAEVRIITENLNFSARLPKLFHRAFDLQFDRQPQKGQEGKQVFQITDGKKLDHIINLFGYDPGQNLVLHINFGLLEEECCQASFLRGVFFAGGSITDPLKRYHLELATSHFQVSRELDALLQECGFAPKIVVRNGSFVTYFKQSEHIEDFLTLIGAPVAAMDGYRNAVKKLRAPAIASILEDFSQEGGPTRFQDGQRITIAGIVSSSKTKTTKNNSLMAYVVVEDDTAAIELLCFSRVLDSCGSYLHAETAGNGLHPRGRHSGLGSAGIRQPERAGVAAPAAAGAGPDGRGGAPDADAPAKAFAKALRGTNGLRCRMADRHVGGVTVD